MWNERPLTFVLLIALIVRLVAVVFSKGFLMHDDHFLIIESAASWADGYDTTSWFPWSPNFPGHPNGHSLFYIGLHYIFFEFTNFIGLENPEIKMYIVRLGHAIYSLLIVFFSYKITERLADWKTARTVGLFLALLAFFPNFSVRNLVEMVTIPPLLWAVWLMVRDQSEKRMNLVFWAAVLAGVAVGIRYQSVIFVGGMGLALLVHRKWKRALIFGLASFASFFVTQGVDLFIWHRPFAELQEYIVYNLEHGSEYFVQPWYNYLLVLAGFLIPPISLFILFGFFKNWKKHLLIFLPTLLFLAFHSIIDNKQERFIVPIIPFVVILGLIGWNEFVSQSSFWQKRRKLLRGCWVFFWVINSLALVLLTTSYNKRSRVESMNYLRERGDMQNFIVEQSHRSKILWPPLFYSNQWESYFWINNEKDIESYAESMATTEKMPSPNYIIFFEDINLQKRVENIRTIFPSLTHVETIEPGLFDKVLHKLNPMNKNPRAHIYYFSELEEESTAAALPK